MKRHLLGFFIVAALAGTWGAARAADTTPTLDSQLAASMNGNSDPRSINTVVDLAFFKVIAIALEEYAIDHNAAYPRSLGDLTPVYLKMVPVVAGSPSGSRYGYSAPPPDAHMGHYLITDADAQVDATYVKGYKVPKGLNGPPCKPGECAHLSYAQAIGVIGSP